MTNSYIERFKEKSIVNYRSCKIQTLVVTYIVVGLIAYPDIRNTSNWLFLGVKLIDLAVTAYYAGEAVLLVILGTYCWWSTFLQTPIKGRAVRKLLKVNVRAWCERLASSGGCREKNDALWVPIFYAIMLLGVLALSLVVKWFTKLNAPVAYAGYRWIMDIVSFSISLCPPSVMILGPSDREMFNVLACVGDALRPLRVVHLLDPRDTYEEMLDSRLLTDTYRSNEVDWNSIFERLVQCVPVVVLDTRVATSNILYEAEHLLQDGRHKKLVLLERCGQPNSLLSSLSSLEISLSEIEKTELENLPGILQRRLRQ